MNRHQAVADRMRFVSGIRERYVIDDISQDRKTILTTRNRPPIIAQRLHFHRELYSRWNIMLMHRAARSLPFPQTGNG